MYQVYPRSFADSNGDGIGDLAGLTSRLPYLSELGVDALWLTPFYPSPLADGGYDVSDYRDVDPRLGTLAGFDELVARRQGARHAGHRRPGAQPLLRRAPAVPGGARGRRRAARSGSCSSSGDGRGPGGDLPPNNWPSNFGGSAWTRVPDGQWYLHLFDAGQPDWNWRDPRVPRMFEDIIRFWLDRGVAGLRVDVAHGMFKDPELADAADTVRSVRPSGYYHRPETLELYRSWRAILDSYPADVWPGPRTAIGEVWYDTYATLQPYLAPDVLPQVFNFELVTAQWDALAIRKADRRDAGADHRLARPVGHRQPRRRPPGHPVGRRAGAGRRAAAAGAARLGVRLPGRGARAAGGAGHPGRRAAGSRPSAAPAGRFAAGTGAGCRCRGRGAGLRSDFPERTRLPHRRPHGSRSRPTGARTASPRNAATRCRSSRLYQAALRLRGENPALGVGELSGGATGDGGLPGKARSAGWTRRTTRWCSPATPASCSPPTWAAGRSPLPPHREVLLASGALAPDGALPRDTAVWLAT